MEEWIAVTIWKLATTVEYRTLATLFWTGKIYGGGNSTGNVSGDSNQIVPQVCMHTTRKYVERSGGWL